MSRRLLIGSSNLDKAAELQRLLEGTPWEVVSLKELPPVEEPEETADSFEGNALLKARYYANAFDLPCVADDSGLEVDALGGAPGVFSARWAGPNCTYADNNRKLLAELGKLDAGDRKARFVCCAAYADTDGSTHIELGVVEGRIALQPAGTFGFGYDPLFIPAGQQRTFAELSADEKHQVSHRGKAFAKMKAYLESLI